VVPPFGGSSGGSGGAAPLSGTVQQAGAVTYRLIVPSSYSGGATPLLVVYSGTEGGSVMTQNLVSVGPMTGIDGFLCAVLDGVSYYGDSAAGATALDDVRARYNVDNDRTYLLGESAGTSAALGLGFHLRQSYFAAYWANDVNHADAPAQTAAALGFAPWGQAGPGGDYADAQQIVGAMQSAGYQLPSPAPYAGTGAGQHGSSDQFLAAISWFPGKARR
jgi:poly(3-hydroxybutyrate) depolymerase